MQGSAMYQEMLLHMAMAGVKRFLWWRYCASLSLCVLLCLGFQPSNDCRGEVIVGSCWVTDTLWFAGCALAAAHDTPLTRGIELANCVMQEADMLVGDESRRPLSLNDEVSLSDGYVLSGMALGNGTQVWRLTPSDEVAVPPVRVVSFPPVSHDSPDRLGGNSRRAVQGIRFPRKPGWETYREKGNHRPKAGALVMGPAMRCRPNANTASSYSTSRQ
jgi:hypothetical protein